jgi:hypothetical protein
MKTRIGSYRGFDVTLSFDSYGKENRVTLNAHVPAAFWAQWAQRSA